jgi:hypothetical protein
MNRAEVDALIDEELVGELEQAVAKLARQLEQAASRRARVDAAVVDDIERRVRQVESNLKIALAQQAPRDRRRQRERRRPVLTAEVLEKRADAVADEDATLSRGFRDWAAEKEREADG